MLRATVHSRMMMRQAVTIGRTEALITDPDTGKYPYPSAFRDELVRALRYAAEQWGEDTPWTAIEYSHWRALLRKRLDSLIADKRRAVRPTEITVARLITAVRWLWDKKLVSRDAASWPPDYKDQIKRHWKAIKKSDSDPAPFRPKFSREQVAALIESSNFDPRFELLMALGMEYGLGRLSPARRDGLNVNDGTLTVAGKRGHVVVHFTDDQRRAVERALGPGGYLEKIERSYREGEVEDYLLFPAGYVVGRVGRSRGKNIAMSLSEKVDFSEPVTSSWVRKSFREAERRAGIKHVPGRNTLAVSRGIAEVHARPKGSGRAATLHESTGWPKVDRQLHEAKARLTSGFSEEHFQMVGLVCREAMISVAQEVYEANRHTSQDGVTPSPTDAARMFEAFFAHELAGGPYEEARTYAKAALKLAVALQHSRGANPRMAALCFEATASVTNLVAILAGQRHGSTKRNR